KIDLKKYQTIVFDCDGVVLNSNKVKTEAFYNTTQQYGEQNAKALVEYHTANGGISRYKKFEYFIEHILKKEIEPKELESLLKSFADEVKKALMSCEVAEGLHDLKESTPDANWLIVSGGDQEELREVFEARGLMKLFDGGIFGSPDTKDEILNREQEKKNISQDALFLGDSKYDYQAAKRAGLDFLFMSDWTEVDEWEKWCQAYTLHICSNIKVLTISIKNRY
ncbi:MAG: HAD-IA family hydrolase, partial [Campylobacterota bacterium]|nr:HAD-IA family hydrolase [Campylobacterota bacterium]